MRIRQNNLCNECDAPLVAKTFHIDHIKPLSEGGQDSLDAVQALCVCCHGEKSERERLGAVYARPLYSQLNRDVLEGFFDAPKPRQLVFGDGEERCIEIDTIGCRVNALVKGYVALPIANIVDTSAVRRGTRRGRPLRFLLHRRRRSSRRSDRELVVPWAELVLTREGDCHSTRRRI